MYFVVNGVHECACSSNETRPNRITSHLSFFESLILISLLSFSSIASPWRSSGACLGLNVNRGSKDNSLMYSILHPRQMHATWLLQSMTLDSASFTSPALSQLLSKSMLLLDGYTLYQLPVHRTELADAYNAVSSSSMGYRDIQDGPGQSA
jgi:hypothetical protein